MGFRLTWTFNDGAGGPSVQFIQEVLVSGPVDGSETVDNTAIRETHTVRNMGPGSLSFGLRKMWDWQIGFDDGPWFGDCTNPDAACDTSMNLTADGVGGNGAYPRSYVINEEPAVAECPPGVPPRNPAGCSGNPLYIAAGTVKPPSNLVPPPDAPELLQFNSWPSLFNACWEPSLVNNATCLGGDTAVGYFYGRTLATAQVLAANTERSFTQYVVAGQTSCPGTVNIVDTNSPVCSVTIDNGPPPMGHGMAVDDRPSEDTNNNGTLDPGEDLNGNGLIDRDTGITSVALEPGAVNMTLTVDPFVPGQGTVTYTVTPTNPALPAVGIVTVTDGAGNTCSSPITLGTFDPFGGIVRTTTRTVTAHITRPNLNTAGVRCVETTNPANPDFDSIPFTPFSGDSADIEILLSEGDGTKIICCQFIDVQNNISPPVCSEIVLDTGGGCQEGQPCDDGNACTTNDSCVAGTCTGGPPPACNDGNICTTDGCNPATGCTHVSNHTCDGNPKGPGYWRQLCRPPDDGDNHGDDHGDDHGTHGGAPPGEFLTQADVDCVNDTCTFASVGTVADICDRLTPNPGGDKCEKAEAQFMALMLNVCRQRITDGDVTQSHCEGAEDDHSDDDHNGPDGTSTVGEVRSEVDALLCGSPRTEAQCKRAECLAKQINSGEALGVNSLRVEKTANGELKLTWSEPYHTDASLARPRYYIWRREGQSGPFVVQGQTSNLFFVDTTAQNGDYQYEITVIW